LRLAAIDVGSNAARLLICEVHTDTSGCVQLQRINQLRVPVRLGLDVFTTGAISIEKAVMLADTLDVFKRLIQLHEVERFRACATSALRDAANGEEITQVVSEKAGVEIEIISGQEEAELMMHSLPENMLRKTIPTLFIDVGGGSTELALFFKGKKVYAQSFNIGTLRMLADSVKTTEWKKLKKEVVAQIAPYKSIAAVGSGGNIGKAFSMSKLKEGKALPATFLETLYNDLKPLSVPERINQYQLKEDRADVLVPALSIYNQILELAKVDKIFVPKISVSEGIIRQLMMEKES